MRLKYQLISLELDAVQGSTLPTIMERIEQDLSVHINIILGS